MTSAPPRAAGGAIDVLTALVRGEWIDPDTGSIAAIAMPAIAIEPTLHGLEADHVASLHVGSRLAVVSDAITHEALGARVERALQSIACIDPVRLPAHVHADVAAVDAVRQAAGAADAFVAVGSGTINDVTKFAAAREGKPYCVFPTAPSMNGYTSANAAITVDGHKKTLAATLARGVFVDLAVLSAAPKRMIRAGLGDSLCRSTAQVDWLLSSHLLDTPYRRAPFAMLADDEPALLDHSQALLEGDREAMAALVRTLLLSGLGMTLCGSSMPASQGEHLVSHYIDMRSPAGRAPFLHGEQVGVATLTLARLQEAIVDGPPPRLHACVTHGEDLQRHFGADVGAECWREFAPKQCNAERAAVLSERLATAWPALCDAIAAVRVRSSAIERALVRANAPTTPEDIGLSAGFYAAAVANARFLRNRYTFLDLAADSGRLEASLAA